MTAQITNLLGPISAILVGLALILLGALLLAASNTDLTQRPRRASLITGWIVVLILGVAVLVIAILLLIAVL